MKYYFDVRFGKSIKNPLQIIFVENGVAKGINENNHSYYDASNIYLDYNFAEIDLVQVSKNEVNDVLSKWGVL